MMEKLYFCGTDTYDCFKLRQNCSCNTTGKMVHNRPHLVSNIRNAEFAHFFHVYQKGPEDTSWYLNGLGFTKEVQVFSCVHNIKQVVATKNSIVALTEEGELYKTRLVVKEATAGGIFVEATNSEHFKLSCQKIAANEDNVYVIQNFPDKSTISKLGSSLECIATFPKQTIIELSVGHGHFVALSDTGAVFNWGNCGRSEISSSGKLNVMKTCEEPVRVEFFDDLACKVIQVKCGGWHTLALTSEGDVYTWGWNESGQLGLNGDSDNNPISASGSNIPHPVELGSAVDSIVDIGAGSRHSAALLRSGRVYSWGNNMHGQIGLGDIQEVGEPREIEKCWEGNACKISCGKWSTFIKTNSSS